MAMATLQLPSIPPLLPARNGCVSSRPRMVALSCKYCQCQSTNAQGRTRFRNHITRRDTLSFMSSAMLAAFLVASPAPAEARTSRLENKKKAMEKLREKALGPKENRSSGKEMPPPANLLIPPAAVEASL
ncbi:unnamed protein product [Urochloa humidicola]